MLLNSVFYNNTAEAISPQPKNRQAFLSQDEYNADGCDRYYSQHSQHVFQSVGYYFYILFHGIYRLIVHLIRLAKEGGAILPPKPISH